MIGFEHQASRVVFMERIVHSYNLELELSSVSYILSDSVNGTIIFEIKYEYIYIIFFQIIFFLECMCIGLGIIVVVRTKFEISMTRLCIVFILFIFTLYF